MMIEVYFPPTLTRPALSLCWAAGGGFHVLTHTGTPSGTATSEYKGGSLVFATLTLFRLLVERK